MILIEVCPHFKGTSKGKTVLVEGDGPKGTTEQKRGGKEALRIPETHAVCNNP